MSNISNREAKKNYQILDTIKAGISLLGNEVKSIRKGNMTLTGSKVLIRGNEAFLVGAHIPAYQPKNTDPSYDPNRTRKLLITKKELLKLENTKGLTLVPVFVYNTTRHIKLEIGLARKKVGRDKREKIRQRDDKKLQDI